MSYACGATIAVLRLAEGNPDDLVRCIEGAARHELKASTIELLATLREEQDLGARRILARDAAHNLLTSLPSRASAAPLDVHPSWIPGDVVVSPSAPVALQGYLRRRRLNRLTIVSELHWSGRFEIGRLSSLLLHRAIHLLGIQSLQTLAALDRCGDLAYMAHRQPDALAESERRRVQRILSGKQISTLQSEVPGNEVGDEIGLLAERAMQVSRANCRFVEELGCSLLAIGLSVEPDPLCRFVAQRMRRDVGDRFLAAIAEARTEPVESRVALRSWLSGLLPSLLTCSPVDAGELELDA